MFITFRQNNSGGYFIQNEDVDVYVMGWACLPLVCLVLTVMATRRILKDEAMVRAADRLR